MTSTDDRTEPDAEQGSGPSHPFGPELGPLVDEVRRFATVVGEKAQETSATTLIALSGLADRLRTQQPEVYSHLAAAGSGLAAAGHEQRWTAGDGAPVEKIDLDEPGRAEDAAAADGADGESAKQ